MTSVMRILTFHSASSSSNMQLNLLPPVAETGWWKQVGALTLQGPRSFLPQESPVRRSGPHFLCWVFPGMQWCSQQMSQFLLLIPSASPSLHSSTQISLPGAASLSLHQTSWESMRGHFSPCRRARRVQLRGELRALWHRVRVGTGGGLHGALNSDMLLKSSAQISLGVPIHILNILWTMMI